MQRVYVEIIAFFSVSLCRGALVLFFLFKSKHISDFCFNAADLDSNWDFSCRPGITRTFKVDFVLFRLIFLFLFFFARRKQRYDSHQAAYSFTFHHSSFFICSAFLLSLSPAAQLFHVST